MVARGKKELGNQRFNQENQIHHEGGRNRASKGKGSSWSTLERWKEGELGSAKETGSRVRKVS